MVVVEAVVGEEAGSNLEEEDLGWSWNHKEVGRSQSTGVRLRRTVNDGDEGDNGGFQMLSKPRETFFGRKRLGREARRGEF